MAELMLADVFGKDGLFQWWQGLLLLALVALIIFWVMYRRRQV